LGLNVAPPFRVASGFLSCSVSFQPALFLECGGLTPLLFSSSLAGGPLNSFLSHSWYQTIQRAPLSPLVATLKYEGAGGRFPGSSCRGRLLRRTCHPERREGSAFFSSLTTAVWCRGTMPGDTEKFPPTLKVSYHYEPNDPYHMNIRNRPVCPRFPDFRLRPQRLLRRLLPDFYSDAQLS